MSQVAVNPEILRWARESAGLTVSEAAAKLHINTARNVSPTDRLQQLEEGKTPPTRALILKMSKQYRRPLLTFYLEQPPSIGDRGEDFRRLPDNYTESDEALVDALLRNIRTRQSIVRAVLEDEDGVEPLPFIGSANLSDGIDRVSQQIIENLTFDLSDFRKCSNTTKAFKYLRAKAEEAGVYVLILNDLGSHHSSIEMEIFRGFALADSIAPFVIVNGQDARAAWSFTLLHELAHLWLGQTGVSGAGALAYSNIERFCNDVAGKILLKNDEISEIELTSATSFENTLDVIETFASARNISRSMVAYKIYRAGIISDELWNRLRLEFRQQWINHRNELRRRGKEQDGGPNPYTVKRYKTGPALLELVSRSLSTGAITTTKAGMVLGIKPNRVYKLIRHAG